MRILLTNDDGIHAEGLASLERIARTISDDVWIVAPETDQSGFAHSLSLSQPLHFGDYGGLGLKIVWAVLDVITIVILISGLYLWLARRRRAP